jgi:CRISPR-associated protein Csx17
VTTYIFREARGRSLQRYLAALGLYRVIASQADSTATCRFDDVDFVIETSVADLPTWLVDSYSPSPYFSPWNGAGGFGLGAGNAGEDAIKKLTDADGAFAGNPRLELFARAYKICKCIAQRAKENGWKINDKKDKARLVREIRNACPDEMLPWIDACVVVLGNGELDFPPLLGTGGNDGRLEFSSNYHQHVLRVLPTTAAKRKTSLSWAADAINGTEASKLVQAAVGQFDPGSSGTPNSSPFGSADSFVNPWLYILMLEGAVWFASSPARRLSMQAESQPRAARTFTTYPSPVAILGGSDTEESRGEVWTPSWRENLALAGVQRIFTEGRAVWRGATAIDSSSMYLAIASKGVADGIAALDRYGIIKRNGLSFVAVRADTMKVPDTADQSLKIVSEVETWPTNQLRSDSTTVARAARRFAAARVDLAKAPTSESRRAALLRMLSAVTDTEVAVGNSSKARERTSPRQPLQASVLLDGATDLDLFAIREFRLALGFATLKLAPAPGAQASARRSLRELIMPVEKTPSGKWSWTDRPVVQGYSSRDIMEVLADVLIAHVIAADSRTLTPEANDGDTTESLSAAQRPARLMIGVPGPSSGFRVPESDLHALARSEIDTALFSRWLAALLPLEWDSKASAAARGAMAGLPLVTVPSPRLAILRTLRADRVLAPADNAVPIGLTTEMVSALARGSIDSALGAAIRRLRQMGYGTIAPSALALTESPKPETVLAAALLPSARGQSPSTTIVYPLRSEENMELEAETEHSAPVSH